MNRLAISILLFIMLICFLLSSLIDDEVIQKDKDRSDKKKRPEIYKAMVDLATNQLKANPATLMAKSSDIFLDIPKFAMYVFSANEEYLSVQPQTSSKTQYLLKYDNIIKFELIDVKDLKIERAGSWRLPFEREYTHKILHLEYYSNENNKISCNFTFGKTYGNIHGNTFEDRFYNEIASQGEDIFEYVNARIPKQDNTVIL